MKPRPTALIVDGERAIRRLVRVALEQECYHVIDAENGRCGLEAIVEERPDVILLDLDLPDMDGLVVLGRLREWSQKPVLVLSERSLVADKVSALDGGANDYLTKPFDVAELLARLRVLRRSLPGIPDGPLLIDGDLKVDLATHEATFKGQQLSFTPTEEALFYLLVRHAGKVVTRKHLTRCVWGTDEEDKIRDLQVYVASLRGKLGAFGGEILIRTEGSVGYCLSLANPDEHATVAVPA